MCERLPYFSLASISKCDAERIHNEWVQLHTLKWEQQQDRLLGKRWLGSVERHLACDEITLVFPVLNSQRMKANLWQICRPRFSSHVRLLTRGRFLLMNKVSVLRFGDHSFSSALFPSRYHLTFMRLGSSTWNSDGAGSCSTVKGQRFVLFLDARLFIL